MWGNDTENYTKRGQESNHERDIEKSIEKEKGESELIASSFVPFQASKTKKQKLFFHVKEFGTSFVPIVKLFDNILMNVIVQTTKVIINR